MTTAPAGWYDDPENPGQNRYWDGSQWTDFRAPTVPASSPNSGASAWTTVSDAFSLLGRHWRDFVLLTTPLLFVNVAGMIALVAGFDRSLNVGVAEFLDRVTSPGFDPTDGSADEAFIEGLSFSVGGGSVALWIVGSAVLTLGGLLWWVAASRFALGAHHGHPPTVGDAYRSALLRLPRMIGFSIVYAVTVVAITAVVLLVGFALPLTLVLSLPASLAALVWAIPFVMLTTIVISAGPPEGSAWSTAVGLVRGRWWRIVGRLLIVGLIVFAIGIPAGAVTGPFYTTSLWGGVVVNTIVGLAQNLIGLVGLVYIYVWMNGPVDPELRAEPQAI